jgi:hypothetical protein
MGSIAGFHEETHEVVHRRADLGFGITFDKQVQRWEFALAGSLARSVVIAFGGNRNSSVIEDLGNVRAICDGPLLRISISYSEEGRRAWMERMVAQRKGMGKVVVLAW